MLTKIQMACLTETTQIQMFGKVTHKRYDHSIHPNGRKTAKQNTKRVKIKLKSGKEVWQPAGTEPPRTRDGQTYPGGRPMRKALARLALRTQRHMGNVTRGHEKGADFYKPGSPSRKHPGSMSR